MSAGAVLQPPNALVCFAVKQEAAPFLRLGLSKERARVLLTGMGMRNSHRSIAEALNSGPMPLLVISSGFAGGLKPGLPRGVVLYEAGERFKWDEALRKAGAIPGAFHCGSRVVPTREGKRALRQRTGADAVEMESLSIHEACRHRRVPFVTIRVILDTAEEDLPLDFGALLNPEEKIDPARLTWALARSPAKIPALLRLGRHSAEAARALAAVLGKFLQPN